MRPPPPDSRATMVAAWMVLGLLVVRLLAGCSRRPTAYDWDLEPPQLGLDHCARAMTADGETVELCASSRRVCRFAVATARAYGRSWLIREADLRLDRLSECRPRIEIDVQRAVSR